jgi:hypothetical protein
MSILFINKISHFTDKQKGDYMNLKSAFKEVISGILPIFIIITLLQFTIIKVDTSLYLNFFLSSFLVVGGLTLFLIGIHYGFLKAGEHIGKAIIHLGRISIILLIITLLGFGVTLVEPDVQVFSNQAASIIPEIDGGTFCIFIALGVGIFTALAFLKMIVKVPIKYILLFGYILAFILAFNCPELFAVAFDAGGATTCALTVPFILALAMGFSSVISKKSKSSNSLGIIGIASLGPVLASLIMGVIGK